jgi:hypothetical protein
MRKFEKLLLKIISGSSDNNIDFEQLRRILIRLEFTERVKGGHHIFFKEDIEEIINIQSKKGLAKPYQVKQIRNIIVKYKLAEDEE